MALQSTPGSVFVLANSAPAAFRSALASAATGVLPPSAVADASAPSSVNLVGLAAVGATLAAAASTRRRTQKVTRNFFGGDGTPARPSFEVSNQSGIQVEDPEARKTKLAAELANGRLAMMAIIGMFFQDGLTGSAWGDWSLYTASPLRAASSFAGYQAPQAEKSGRAAVVARRAENIAATAIANGNFTILVKALQKAGLVETVSDILLYHVAGGTTMSSSLKDGMRVTSAQGAQLNVQIGGGTVKVGRATVTAADVACSNGVIHVIDKVLLPPAKPAEAFDPAQQIGAMAPLGFFDPLGFSKKGDKAGFNNLQASEIKHGRVAMMAALGAVVQHYVKFPGFESVPTGLGAVTTAPGTYGFAALFLVSGVLELAIWTQDDKKEPGNFGDPAGLNMYNPEMRQKEINNGRMGMFSAIGIIGAEVLSGKDGMNQLGF
ncbi:unnamed protein product [Polarella glacialis]|uniref:FAS1 domain-containing protein n=1 Tax=Polarella glacialis TaxID=89957 RepID=A0A813GZT0_POLGL|nr:unnamed protein product [Polarella glacialis]